MSSIDGEVSIYKQGPSSSKQNNNNNTNSLLHDHQARAAFANDVNSRRSLPLSNRTSAGSTEATGISNKMKQMQAHAAEAKAEYNRINVPLGTSIELAALNRPLNTVTTFTKSSSSSTPTHNTSSNEKKPLVLSVHEKNLVSRTNSGVSYSKLKEEEEKIKLESIKVEELITEENVIPETQQASGAEANDYDVLTMRLCTVEQLVEVCNEYAYLTTVPTKQILMISNVDVNGDLACNCKIRMSDNVEIKNVMTKIRLYNIGDEITPDECAKLDIKNILAPKIAPCANHQFLAHITYESTIITYNAPLMADSLSIMRDLVADKRFGPNIPVVVQAVSSDFQMSKGFAKETIESILPRDSLPRGGKTGEPTVVQASSIYHVLACTKDNCRVHYIKEKEFVSAVNRSAFIASMVLNGRVITVAMGSGLDLQRLKNDNPRINPRQIVHRAFDRVFGHYEIFDVAQESFCTINNLSVSCLDDIPEHILPKCVNMIGTPYELSEQAKTLRLPHPSQNDGGTNSRRLSNGALNLPLPELPLRPEVQLSNDSSETEKLKSRYSEEFVAGILESKDLLVEQLELVTADNVKLRVDINSLIQNNAEEKKENEVRFIALEKALIELRNELTNNNKTIELLQNEKLTQSHTIKDLEEKVASMTDNQELVRQQRIEIERLSTIIAEKDNGYIDVKTEFETTISSQKVVIAEQNETIIQLKDEALISKNLNDRLQSDLAIIRKRLDEVSSTGETNDHERQLEIKGLREQCSENAVQVEIEKERYERQITNLTNQLNMSQLAREELERNVVAHATSSKAVESQTESCVVPSVSDNDNRHVIAMLRSINADMAKLDDRFLHETFYRVKSLRMFTDCLNTFQRASDEGIDVEYAVSMAHNITPNGLIVLRNYLAQDYTFADYEKISQKFSPV